MSLLDDWQGAEATLGRTRALHRAAEQLPPRLATLLQALEALEDGRRDEVRRVAELARAGGHEDVAMILELLLSPPAEVDPTALRKEGKRRGIDKDREAPVLDLLRALAVAHTGELAPPPPALRAAQAGRPALAAAVRLFTSKANRVMTDRALRRWSPRAEQVQAVAHAHRLGARVDRAWVERNFPPCLLALGQERWADLAPDEHTATLQLRLAGKQPWDAGHDPSSDWLIHLPRERLQPWLSQILALLARSIPRGEVKGLAGAAHVGVHLAERLGKPLLARQLMALDARLRWMDPFDGMDPDLVAMLFMLGPDEIGRGERTKLARAVLSFAHGFGEALMGEAAAWVAAITPDPEEAMALHGEWLVELPSEIWKKTLLQAGAQPERLALITGADAARRLRFAELLEILSALPPQSDATLCAVGGVLADRIQEKQRLRPRERKEVGRVLGLLASGPATRGRLNLLQRLLPWADAVPASVDAAVDAALSSVQELGSEARGSAIGLALTMGRTEPARAIVLQIGRQLRRMPPDAADDLALGVVAGAIGPRAIALDHPVHGILEPLSRFLLRAPDRALQASQRLGSASPQLSSGLFTWYLAHHHELVRDPFWVQLMVQMVFPEGLGGIPQQEAFVETIYQAIGSAPQTMSGLAAEFMKAFGEQTGLFAFDMLNERDDGIPW